MIRAYDDELTTTTTTTGVAGGGRRVEVVAAAVRRRRNFSFHAFQWHMHGVCNRQLATCVHVGHVGHCRDVFFSQCIDISMYVQMGRHAPLTRSAMRRESVRTCTCTVSTSVGVETGDVEESKVISLTGGGGGRDRDQTKNS